MIFITVTGTGTGKSPPTQWLARRYWRMPSTGCSTRINFRHLLLLMVLMSGGLTAAELQAGTIEQQHLFKIERSKNANIVQYDARVRPDGTLDPDKPVAGYWIRLAEDGRKMKLRFLEKRFVYGFKTTYDPVTNSAALVMKAKIGRDMKILKTPDGFRAMIMIDGRDALIDTIFVQASGKRYSKKVDYIELHGVDPVTGEERYEKFFP